jgi:membrane-associated phospholipid phosphatase
LLVNSREFDSQSGFPPAIVPAVVVTASTPRTREARAGRLYARGALCSVTLLLLVIAERLLLSRHMFPGDSWAAQLGTQVVISHKPSLVWAITRIYQQIGRPLVAIGEVLVMLAWLWRAAGRRAAQGLLIVLLASATCGLIKIICGPTPLWVSLYHVGTNFPSGVVTFMTASVGYVALVAWRQGRKILPLILLLAILCAGPARVLGGQHLPSDVLGGYMLGMSWLILAYMYLVGPHHRIEGEAPWSIASLEAPA